MVQLFWAVVRVCHGPNVRRGSRPAGHVPVVRTLHRPQVRAYCQPSSTTGANDGRSVTRLHPADPLWIAAGWLALVGSAGWTLGVTVGALAPFAAAESLVGHVAIGAASAALGLGAGAFLVNAVRVGRHWFG
ncbi:MAG: hypothetical protein M3O34_14285, partial [Chloroflexota bacterium]|nr:hypothetical protein [Chloroflexota bacterium]